VARRHADSTRLCPPLRPDPETPTRPKLRLRTLPEFHPALATQAGEVAILHRRWGGRHCGKRCRLPRIQAVQELVPGLRCSFWDQLILYFLRPNGPSFCATQQGGLSHTFILYYHNDTTIQRHNLPAGRRHDMKLDELKSLLQRNNLWAKKGLGQNFLVDEKVFDMIIKAANLIKTDFVIEVGPGTGFLTERLIEKAGHVTAVEYDVNMVRLIKERFKGVKNLTIIHSDILRTKDYARPDDTVGRGLRAKRYKVVANIPYYITSPLIKHFLQSDCRPELMVLLVQKEVAEKICGISGKSLITIETQLFGKPEIVGNVPSSSFYPEPKVDSAILRINVYEKPLVSENQLSDFLRIVKFGFSQKRKKLSNTLGAGLHVKPSEMAEILRGADINPDLRPENLEIGDWKRLTEILTKMKK